MAAYLLGQIIIHDMEKFMPYVAGAGAAIAKYGGEVLDVVEAKEVLEGNWPVGARTAPVRFPDETSLRRFWNSLENVPMKELRHGTATATWRCAFQFQTIIRQSKPRRPGNTRCHEFAQPASNRG